ncbi:hypothetical protein D9611_001187 [Ephemerocybe angulata]|uniref:HTH APSES-type domain-containing protein n=1 Tax=Ephemerocybe angulata TaxID=980116 RepID=A0A8H5FME0_9AGAR|nr:hypothetical protein D9611_001187 [Tulosesus angulatus]
MVPDLFPPSITSMASGMLQDTLHAPSTSSSAGPRFRPYASPEHHVTKGRYITSNDARGYIPVYEYPLNGQWIMMDIDDGYILWTGIWKALGNSKADIVKMIDSQPDLAPLIRRVRGGYLKIQGTWMPYEVALKLSRRVAWSIRHDLVPLFGPTFPSTCLSPDQPGYGQVVANSQTRRRARRNTQAAAVTQIPREPHSNWTVVTPGGPANIGLTVPHQRPSQYSRRPSHPSVGISPDPSEYSSSPQYSHRQIDSPDYHNPNRYAPYSSHSSPIDRKASVGGRGGLSLEIPPHVLNRPSSAKPQENISLPPIKQPEESERDSGSPYALPPISALEDLRGVDTQDSAAVLRRLRLDDDYPSSLPIQDQHWARRHSVSAQPHSNRSSDSSRFQPYYTPRSYQEYTFKRSRSPSESLIEQRRRSDFSQEDSCSNPSPISPATPLSSHEHSSFSDLKKLASMTDRRYPFPRISAPASREWGQPKSDLDNIRDASAYRLGPRSPLDADSDSESSSIPHRPWL